MDENGPGKVPYGAQSCSDSWLVSHLCFLNLWFTDVFHHTLFSDKGFCSSHTFMYNLTKEDPASDFWWVIFYDVIDT